MTDETSSLELLREDLAQLFNKSRLASSEKSNLNDCPSLRMDRTMQSLEILVAEVLNCLGYPFDTFTDPNDFVCFRFPGSRPVDDVIVVVKTHDLEVGLHLYPSYISLEAVNFHNPEFCSILQRRVNLLMALRDRDAYLRQQRIEKTGNLNKGK